MPVYSIVNPSDPYTFEAPDVAIAFGVAVFIGGGMYAMDPVEKGAAVSVPFFLSDGSTEAWCQRTFGQSLNDVIATLTGERLGEVADALDSVLVGEPGDRATEIAILANAPTGRAHLLRDERHDARRSSMNDIGRRAWGIADSLRRKLAEREGRAA